MNKIGKSILILVICILLAFAIGYLIFVGKSI